jgi:bifunctional DNA-binding transcriptional regulator/antitoxin component of YhaV-PrlF toxin-antitoxin module
MTVTVKNKTPLVVPNRVRREAGFKTGDRVQFKVSRGAVTILHKPPTTQDPDDTLTAAEAKKVRHALKQVREKKTKPWTQVKHELGL